MEALPWAELPAPARANGESATACLVRCLVCRSACYAVCTGGGRAAVIGVDGIAIGTTAAAGAAGTGEGIQGPLGGARRKGGRSGESCQGGDEESRVLHVEDVLRG